MKLATIRADAASVARAGVNRRIPASAGYTEWEWQWFAVLGAVAGKEFPVVEGVRGGMAGAVYVLIRDAGPFESGGRARSIASPVAAIPADLIESTRDDGAPPVPVPIESRDLSGPKAWWKAEGWDIVRLVTPDVDGFCAFTKHKGD